MHPTGFPGVQGSNTSVSASPGAEGEAVVDSVKMGGMPELRLFAPAERDLDQVIGMLDRHVRNDKISIVPVLAPPGRADHLLQRLGGIPDHPDLAAIGFDQDFLADQFTTPIKGIDVALLSMASDLETTPWVHRQHGWIIEPPADWETAWSQDLKDRFTAAFEQTNPISPDTYLATMRDVIGAIREKTDAHIVLYGASTLGVELHPSYHGREDDHRLRAHRFNAAQIRLSMALGASIVDVDRLIANVGGKDHVSGPLGYDDTANDVIAEDVVYVLGDIGFFQKRPLVAQVGQEYGAA